MSSSGTASTPVANWHDRLVSNAATASSAAAANSAATTSSRIVSSNSTGNENRVEMLHRTGSLLRQKQSTSAVLDSPIDRKPGTIESTQDRQAGSGAALDQSQADLQASQHIQSSSSGTVSDQSMAALVICTAMYVVSAMLSCYVRTSLQWLDHGAQQDQSNMTVAVLPLAAMALSSLQVSSKKALGGKRDSQAQDSSRWGTRLSNMVPGALSSWNRIGSSLSSSLSGHLQRGILV
ncbi:hypothetical protein PG994_004808 [Apiospora phragmitis]|uniref:Uncharacterized protein n=1 Tax=Apiospora phragmitis TaxID=2905665 RepID=A0ABR1VVI0_9PEZI